MAHSTLSVNLFTFQQLPFYSLFALNVIIIPLDFSLSLFKIINSHVCKLMCYVIGLGVCVSMYMCVHVYAQKNLKSSRDLIYLKFVMTDFLKNRQCQSTTKSPVTWCKTSYSVVSALPNYLAFLSTPEQPTKYLFQEVTEANASEKPFT